MKKIFYTPSLEPVPRKGMREFSHVKPRLRLVLRMGVNSCEEKAIAYFREHDDLFRACLESGAIRIGETPKEEQKEPVGPETLDSKPSDFTVKQLTVSVLDSIEDIGLLRRWLQADTRESGKEAIADRIAELEKAALETV